METASASTNPAVEAEIAAWIASGRAFGGKPRQIDTHAASVFLIGDRAWKLKKPVDLGYLDFSSSTKRHDALAAELGLNRRTAPDLYLGLHKVTRAADGSFALDLNGAAVDWLLEMRRFADDALLADMADLGAISDTLLTALADDLVLFHAAAEVMPWTSGTDQIRHVADGNAERMALYPHLLDPNRVSDVMDAIARRISAQASLLDQRAAQGRIRHGHGDLHLGNIAVIDDKAIPFDCLEFDPALATSDVLYDLAFLLMDLWTRGLRRQANILFNRYLDRSPEDESGLALMPLFMSIRATIRAHVLATLATQGGNDEAGPRAVRYLEAAKQLLAEPPPQLVAIGGLSGSGKSTVARIIAEDIGVVPGARILRTDVLRKRLAGIAPETSLDRATYTKEASALVYSELGRLAAKALAAGHAVIADAVFGHLQEKTDIAEIATKANIPFRGFWLELDESARVARIAGRASDASDATAAVARQQTADRSLGSHGWSCLSAARDKEVLRREILAALTS